MAFPSCIGNLVLITTSWLSGVNLSSKLVFIRNFSAAFIQRMDAQSASRKKKKQNKTNPSKTFRYSKLTKLLLYDYLVQSRETKFLNDPQGGNLRCSIRPNLPSHLQPNLNDLQWIGEENLGGSSLKTTAHFHGNEVSPLDCSCIRVKSLTL